MHLKYTMYVDIVKPCSQTLSHETHFAQPQLSANKSKDPISPIGTGADTKSSRPPPPYIF